MNANEFPKGLINYQPMYKWTDAQTARTKLHELYVATMANASGAIDYYRTCKRSPRRWAKSIRFIAIILFVGSTTIPYFANMSEPPNMQILYWGYIMAGLGGGLLLLDRYSGYTNSWVRFVLLAQQLESLYNNFLQQWQSLLMTNPVTTPRDMAVMMDSLVNFQVAFQQAIRSDTEAWAKEFMENLEALMVAMKQQSDDLKSQLDTLKETNVNNNAATTAKQDTAVPHDIIVEAIEKNFSDWKTTFGVVSVSAGKKRKNELQTDVNAIVFGPVNKLSTDSQTFVPIPATIPFQSAAGQLYDIPTDVRETKSVIKASAKLLCDNTVPKRPGCSISRKGNNATGTFGLLVYKDNQPHILGCYHVLCAPELNAGIRQYTSTTAGTEATIVSPGFEDDTKGMTLGKVVDGRLTGDLDCAIAKVDDPLYVVGEICSIDKAPQRPLLLTDAHADARYPLKAVGRTNGVIEGEVQDVYTTCEVHYMIKNKWTPVTMSGLICTDQLAEGGDSGAPVVDKKNNIIGIIIASSENYTYITPIQRILGKLAITLKPYPSV